MVGMATLSIKRKAKMIPLPGGKKVYADSTGKQIAIGDKLRFRGQEYTLKGFGPMNLDLNVATLIFEEPLHTNEVPDEISVDKI